MGTTWDSVIKGFEQDRAAYAGRRGTSRMSNSAWDALMYSPSRRGSTYSGGPGSRSGGKVDSDYIISGLMKRGLPQHVAEGFAMNMQDESGLNAGINERNPIVKGSRGGYGLYQLTGPRRRQYEAFAKNTGARFDDPDAQMDFLMWELENTERGAASHIMNSRSSGEAGAAIVNKFLRPAEKHRIHRAKKYLAGGAPSARYIKHASTPTTKLWLDI